MLKDTILKKLREADAFLSGQKLADELKVSRNAVWKAVKALQEDGYGIESVKNMGYRLDHATSRLSRREILFQSGLSEDQVLVFEQIPSTNTYLKDRHSQLSSGTAILAQSQVSGRGRAGRSFYSPPGEGLYVSLLYKGPDMPRSEYVTVAAAVALREVLERCGLMPSIKWVNDLYVSGRKIAGILTEGELELESGRMKYLVLGIGLNVNHTAFPDELKDIAISMKQAAGRGFDLNRLAADLLSALSGHMARLSSALPEETYKRNTAELIARYNQTLYLKGQTVTLTGGNHADLTGTLLGTDAAGHLLIQTDDTIRTASYGEYRLSASQRKK